jgi:predicted TIM-barrel fold metal-dependent hydrolase
LSDYQPKSMLVLENHKVIRAKYPVVNVHAHFTYWIEKLSPEEIIKIMDNCGIEKMVDLDGGKKEFEEKIENYKNKHSDKFILFYQIVFPDGTVPDSFFSKSVTELEEAVKMGAKGLKIWKRLGLMTRDKSGKVIPVDDPRLDPIWAKAGELGIPVLIHIADPDAFFLPIDRFNERFEQLQLGDFTGFYKPIFPRKEEIIKQFENVLKKHPDTVFIGAHMLMLAENLGYLESLLDKYPNLYVDLSAQVPELGRQPYTARKFFIRYQDRILFGTDGNPREDDYRDYFRFLETSDEYFDYPFSEIHSFGRWKIYGLYLPDEVLEKIYYKNAKKLLH